MAKKEIGLRERRKIYEDAIGIVLRSQKYRHNNDRFAKNLVDAQIAKCVSIIATTLGYSEEIIEADGKKETVWMINRDESTKLTKEQMNSIVAQLPNNRELKNDLWKSAIKGDSESSNRINVFVA